MPAERPSRTDARRNYDAIVTSAATAFASRGTGASLDEIAASAGVGNATLYRHFPTRETLIVATMRFRLGELTSVANDLRGTRSAADALRVWFLVLANHLRSWRGLPETVVQALRAEASPMRTVCQPLQLSTFMLLLGAQDAGAARAEATSDEVFALIAALAWTADQFGDSDDELRRRIDFAFTGISAQDPPV